MGNIFTQIAAKFTAVNEEILGMFREYDESTKEAILSGTDTVEPEEYGSMVFTKEGLEAMFPGACVLGVIGKPVASVPITVITRIGNQGNYLEAHKGYIQLSIIPTADGSAAAVNRDVRTGVRIGDVSYPHQIINLKMFSADFEGDDQMGVSDLISALYNMQVPGVFRKDSQGNTRMHKNGEKVPVYKGANLVIFFQGSYERGEGDSADIVVTAIAVVDTRQKAARQLRSKAWGSEPKALDNRKVLLKAESADAAMAMLSEAADAALALMGETPEGEQIGTPDSTVHVVF